MTAMIVYVKDIKSVGVCLYYLHRLRNFYPHVDTEVGIPEPFVAINGGVVTYKGEIVLRFLEGFNTCKKAISYKDCVEYIKNDFSLQFPGNSDLVTSMIEYSKALVKLSTIVAFELMSLMPAHARDLAFLAKQRETRLTTIGCKLAILSENANGCNCVYNQTALLENALLSLENFYLNLKNNQYVLLYKINGAIIHENDYDFEFSCEDILKLKIFDVVEFRKRLT